MPKGTALKDSVEVDSVDLSNLARAVTPLSEHSREDVSGFSATGFNEYIAGTTEQSVEVEFYGTFGTGEVHATLWPIHRDREIVEFKWRPDQTAAVSATNPELRGNVQVYNYSPARTRGEVSTFPVTFNAADADGLQYFDAAEG